ncbi:hypothetical protein Poli38472_005304 [Pythium oligandrum]|uniref:ATP-dependent helicase n=1 Tax=Pythium oligandrum TaxID=41045 RepID=A0A8K1FHG0_PYTOL|nr:hypothetical protein Poli38472_005304 [Pythium oligandrum]|eukprot:TMW62686.1 hypothetical protein Poli38472_005304 [Pythium oligandrum]
MVALGVKESVSGKTFTLEADGDEVRVCGGKGAVYLSGKKVALRCCAKATIIVTRKLKQSVLRQGDVGLLDLRDMFYANGTLTKYEVIDTDASSKVTVDMPAVTSESSASSSSTTGTSAVISRSQPAGNVATVAGLRVQATRLDHGRGMVASRYFTKGPQSSTVSRPVETSKKSLEDMSQASKHRSPQDVSDVDMTVSSPPRAKKRSMVVVDDDASSEEDTPKKPEMDEDAATPVKPRAKRSRVIIESDAEDEEDDVVEVSPTRSTRSDVSSPAEEDDVFLRDMKLKQEQSGGASNWMAEFGHGRAAQTDRVSNSTDDDGWYSVRDRNGSTKTKREDSKKRSEALASSRMKHRDTSYDGDEDDGDADHRTRTQGEVGEILLECERIALKLRRSIQSWSDSSSAPTSDDVDANEMESHVSLSAMKASPSGNGGRIVSQSDIPDICETLELKPYQVVGLNWLLLLCENGLSGVLADEMGLGKTVQTISFLLLLHSLASSSDSGKYGGPHLVVVPASVLNNWKREFAWIAPTLRVIVYHGSKDVRFNLQDTLTSDDFDVLLTTYTYFERDTCQDDRNFLRSFRFGYMILDEGHSIKNSKTSRFRRISALRTRNRLVLSGTPIQNNLNELLALLSFLMPKMFDHGSDELLSFFDGTEEKKCAKVRRILAPFILRREKKYVLSQLVAKTIHVEMLKLDDSQRSVYTNLVESVITQKEEDAARKQQDKERKRKNKSKLDRQVQLLLGENYSSSSNRRTESASDSAIFTQLRKAANHPVLLRNHYVSDEVLDTMSRCLHRADAFGNQCSIAMVRKELEGYSDFELHDLCVQYGGNEELRKLQLPMETLLHSAKFDFLRTLLPKLRSEGHRVLIFSQWTKLLDLLEVLMRDMDYRYLRLDGSTDVSDRQQLIDEYNQDTNLFVFLLSTRAGGLGINLTAADTVILHDLDFNPTNDEQACDRCHRIGQTKPVSIYKLVSEDTVDHNIYKLGEAKTQLNNAVLGKLNAHGGNGPKASENVTVEMMLASVLASYKKQ